MVAGDNGVATPRRQDQLPDLQPTLSTARSFRLGLQVLLAATFCALLLRYWSIPRRFPYYWQTDMDHAIVLDSVLLHSNQQVVTVGHPSFGVFLLLVATQKIGSHLGHVSVLTLEDLRQSLNPIAGIAELTDFSRFHSPLLAVAIVVLLWSAICILFRPKMVAALLILLLLGTQVSLVYHSAMIRSEFYAIFYWSVAILLMVLAVRASTGRRRGILMLIAGVALGLSFMTKVQALSYVAAFPLLTWFASQRAESSTRIIQERGFRPVRYLILAIVNLGVFVLLSILAHRVGVGGTKPFRESFGITRVWVLALVVLVAALVAHLYPALRRKEGSAWQKGLCLFVTLPASGFLLSFLLHFLLYADKGIAYRHMLITFKVLFLGVDQWSALPNAPVASITAALANHPVLFLSHGLVLMLLMLSATLPWMRITKIQVLVACLLSGLVLAMPAVGNVRGGLYRDLLWLEILLNLLSITYALVIWARVVKFRCYVTVLCSTVGVALVAANLLYSQRMVQAMHTEQFTLSWQPSRAFSAIFHVGADMQYEEIMQSHYSSPGGSMRRAGVRQALRHGEIRRIVQFVFPAGTVTHRHIGVLAEDFPVWASDQRHRILRFPESMREAIVVDTAAVSSGSRTWLEEIVLQPFNRTIGKATRHKQDTQYPVKTAAVRTGLPVRPRPDLRVFIFVEPDDWKVVVGEQVPDADPGVPEIVLSDGTHELNLFGALVYPNVEIPIANIKGKFFFVIKRTTDPTEPEDTARTP